jgi:hypothetical protein
MKKFLLTALGIAIICLIAYTPQVSVAQVFGEFKSISLVENVPYEDITDGIVCPPYSFALGPNYLQTDRNDGYFKVNLGFDFEFNGEVFNSAWICVNGFITLSPPPYLPAPNPNALFLDANNYPTNVIAPFWGDHYLKTEEDYFKDGSVISGISYKTYSLPADSNGIIQKVFVVQWKDLNINYMLDGENVLSSVGNFQLRLYESKDLYSKQGDIEFAYGTVGVPKDPKYIIDDSRILTTGSVIGIKGEGKIIGEGADYLNGLYFDKSIDVAATAKTKTKDWQPTGGSDKRINFSATVRFNVSEWWGDGDVDFSKAIGRKHYTLPQNRFVTVNDVRLILKSVATGIPLDPVRRREAYHGDVNHNGRYYFNNQNEKILVKKKSLVFTDDLPNEISSVKQVLFQANESDAAWMMLYMSAKITELPWLIDTFVVYGKLAADEEVNAVRLGTITKLQDNEYQIPVYLDNNFKGALGTTFEVNGNLTDVIKVENENNNLMLATNNNRIVISGYGDFDKNAPILIIKAKINDDAISLTKIRINDNEVNDMSINLKKVEVSDATDMVLTNTPNPVIESTTISLNISVAGNYKLAIYDLQGNLVKELFAGDLNAGPSVYEWNTTDVNGQSILPGVYVYKLEGNNLNIVKKLIVAK